MSYQTLSCLPVQRGQRRVWATRSHITQSHNQKWAHGEVMKGTIYLRCPTNWAQSSDCQSQNWRCSSQTQWGRSSAGNIQMKHQMGEKVLKPSQSGWLVSSCNALFESHLCPPTMHHVHKHCPPPNLPSPPSSSIKSTTARLCVHQPGVTSSVSGVVRGLTSGKQSLANTWRRAVFPHWLSPTTTILHFTLWLGSIPDLRDNFWHERLSFIDFTRD